MRNQRSFAMRCGVPLLMLTILAGSLAAADKKKVKKNDFCAQPNPQSLCTTENTCGAGGCSLDVTRTADSSSLKPITAGSKSGKPICVAAGTKVEFMSTEKETGFIIDQGDGFSVRPGRRDHRRERQVGSGRRHQGRLLQPVVRRLQIGGDLRHVPGKQRDHYRYQG